MVGRMATNDRLDNVWARRIRNAFKQSGLSRKQLSEQSGVPYASVHAFIAGTKDPALSTTMKICRVLGLELVSKAQRGS